MKKRKNQMSLLATYAIPDLIPRNKDYAVRVRTPEGEWKELDVIVVKVDMHQVREAALAQFDFEGEVEVEVICRRSAIDSVEVRPLSYGIAPQIVDERTIRFRLDRPRKLSVEINGDRFHNLHLFAKAMDERPDADNEKTVFIKPGIHRTETLLDRLKDDADTLYFAPGVHHIEEVLLTIPSDKSVYLASGAVLIGSLVCDSVENVRIWGRGFVYLADFGRFSAFRGIRMMYSRNVEVEGIVVIDPPHYSIYMGESRDVRIRNFASFSTRGWSDGIDMMACCDVTIEDVFMRNSDDCIAIYAHRWGYYGDVRNITVRHSVLWADVAHPTMIGTHGDYHGEGATIERITFQDIDILEHHEPQEGYRGCLAINAGDKNTIRDVAYEDIRIDRFELGRVIDLRVFWNESYNPAPGKRIERIRFRNIRCEGEGNEASWIDGFDDSRLVEDVRIEDFYMNGRRITDLASGNFVIGPYARNVELG